MSSLFQKDPKTRKIVLYAGFTSIILGLLVLLFTQLTTVCGKDDYYIDRCLVMPTMKLGLLYDGFNPLIFYTISLLIIVIGLAAVYLTIESKKEKTLYGTPNSSKEQINK